MPTSKDDLIDRLARYHQIKLSVIGRKSGGKYSKDFVNPRKSLTRHWLLCRDHRFQFWLRWNDDPCEQVRNDARTDSGSERDKEAEDAHERYVEIEILS